MQSVGIGEMGILHAKRGGFVVHPLHKAVRVAANRVGQDIAGLVGGGKQIAV